MQRRRNRGAQKEVMSREQTKELGMAYKEGNNYTCTKQPLIVFSYLLEMMQTPLTEMRKRQK